MHNETFSKVEHKAHLNKCIKAEIISYILSDHNRIRLQFKAKESKEHAETHGDWQHTKHSWIKWKQNVPKIKWNENTTHPSLHNTVKVAIRGKRMLQMPT